MTREEEKAELIYKEESYAIIGAGFAVYKDKALIQTFSPDFLCYEKIILEIKAASVLVDEHRAQVLNYLSATGCKLGLLVNFGHYPRMEYERLLPRSQEPFDLRL